MTTLVNSKASPAAWPVIGLTDKRESLTVLFRAPFRRSARPCATLRDSFVPVLADTQQTDHLVDGDIRVV